MSKALLRSVDRQCKIEVILSMALLVTFSSLSTASPREVQERAVGECQFLGKVEGSSGYGKNPGWHPLAKASALRRAENLGASDVVWQRMIPVGTFNGIAVARAYRCLT